MNKPREWWIDTSASSKRILNAEPGIIDVGILMDPYIHVIEYGAYEELKNKFEESWHGEYGVSYVKSKDGSPNAGEELLIHYNELKAKLAIAVESLEKIAEGDPRVDYLAKDALEKLK